MLPPRSFASRNSLPLEVAGAPAARQSRFRGLCLVDHRSPSGGHPIY